jgi:hypothetical protein
MPVPIPDAMNLAAPTFDPGANADALLGLLAWCGTAAGVAGVIITGTLMALQLRSGIPGERSEHMRSLFLVFLACIIVATAAPVVTFLGPLGI